MQNIAESRGIAHTADFIAGLYQTEDEQEQGVFHMKILKSRLGPHANLKFQFNGSTMEFTDIDDVDDGAEAVKDSTEPGKKQNTNSLTPVRCEVDDKDLFSGDLGMP